MIRLRGRWEFRSGGRRAEGAESESNPTDLPSRFVSLPFSQREGNTAGASAQHTTLCRTFHRPTGLGPSSRVSLAVDHDGIHAAVWLNDTRLGELTEQVPVVRWDITHAMGDSNRIVLALETVAAGHSPDRTLRSVVLEIMEVGA